CARDAHGSGCDYW
nr:immunoglobulin heavy chain junction region [Macaca mulatta]MOV53553.1 immunoglobulin heavy chain junction region [Macaca mulatta]MOV53883.1 immunoglobulin heavy chain junction region [Macaca mulatta]MOV53989.1 immunoglobulin heavy chain junction region [Macaca mulatta]MOV55709.1 immunoglobulin heavy chain junction region [Macaca mulatta]